MNRLQLIHLSSFFGFLNFSLFVFYHLGCNSFRLFNFQRSSPSSDSFYILSLSLPFVNTLFYLFLKVFLRGIVLCCFFSPCERACLYYHISLCFVKRFFGFFRTFFFLYAKKPLKRLLFNNTDITGRRPGFLAVVSFDLIPTVLFFQNIYSVSAISLAYFFVICPRSLA